MVVRKKHQKTQLLLEASDKKLQRNKKRRSNKKAVSSKAPSKKSSPVDFKKKFSQNRNKRHKSTPNRIRVIPMGGVEEVGRNMIIVEVGDDILIVDMGFEFTSDLETPGIDYILPNTKYLETRKNRIKGVFITHAHLDHIGGIPFIMERIGNPPIYTRKFSALLIEKRQEEYPDKPELKIKVMEPTDGRIKVGNTYVSTFDVTHSIPDATGVKIETPKGNIIISGDLKLDHHDGVPTAEEKRCFGALGKEENLLFIADSTNAEKQGFSITEREVQRNIAEIIRNSTGRLIISTFASQVSRMIQIMKTASKCNKKILLEGRSIRNNLEIAEKMGLVTLSGNLVIESKDLRKYPPESIIILATGAQGEEFASLNRIAQNKHNDIKLTKDDTILFSSSVIPGNEKAVRLLKDSLLLSELQIINYNTSDVHSTGHGNAGELVWMNKMIGAKYFMPGYGHRSMTHAHAKAVMDAGVSRKNIALAENGSVVDLSTGKLRIEKDKIISEMMMVEGNKILESHDELIKERKTLAENGMMNIILTVSPKNHKLKKLPDIVTFGLAEDSQKLVSSLKKNVQNFMRRATLDKSAKRSSSLKKMVEDYISHFVSKKMSKKPVVKATIIEMR